MLRTFLRPKLLEFNDTENFWFQQDGATAHTARPSLEVLREMFPNRLISLRGDIGWPARSPDLAPCDFFLWGHLKAEVFKCRPQTLEELKDIIHEKIANISTETTIKVMESFRKRLRECSANNGRHLTDFIFKTM